MRKWCGVLLACALAAGCGNDAREAAAPEPGPVAAEAPVQAEAPAAEEPEVAEQAVDEPADDPGGRVCGRLISALEPMLLTVQQLTQGADIKTTPATMATLADQAIDAHDVIDGDPAFAEIQQELVSLVSRIDSDLEGLPSDVEPPYTNPAYDRLWEVVGRNLDHATAALDVAKAGQAACDPDAGVEDERRAEFLDEA